MKLILFDIDGTILFAHHVGREAVEAAFERVFGRHISSRRVLFHGKTDRQILLEVMDAEDLQAEKDDRTLNELVAAYTDEMYARLTADRITVLSGVRALVERLHAHPDVQLALLTGNLESIAYLKLKLIDMDHYFPFGAFGSDSVDRYELPAIAVQRARHLTGRTFEGKDVVIVGDTEHDVLCGKSIDVMSVAVATGNYTREDFHAHEPDIVLDDLSDTEEFLNVLGLAA